MPGFLSCPGSPFLPEVRLDCLGLLCPIPSIPPNPPRLHLEVGTGSSWGEAGAQEWRTLRKGSGLSFCSRALSPVERWEP